jgi:Asp-tRNA(Asn)/Glu-tRNA(Gln) amidotransferase A subunit family amidase
VGLLAQDIDLLRAGAAAMLASKAEAGDPVRTVGFDAARIADCTPKTRTAVARVIEAIRAFGYEIKPVKLPDRSATAAAHSVLVLSAALATYASLSAAEIGLLADTAQKSLAAARKLKHSSVAAAEIAAARVTSLLEEVLAQANVILMPTLLVDPPPRGARHVSFDGRDVPVVAALVAETCLANLTGCPALSIPIGVGDPIPASIQLLAARGDDMRLLAFARDLVSLL